MSQPDAPSRRLSDALLRRPALAAAVCLIVGISAHRISWHVPNLWLALSAILLLLAAIFFPRAILSRIALALSILAAGIAAAQIERFGYPADHIAQFAQDRPRLARVELTVDQAPRVLSGGVAGRVARQVIQ